MNFLGTQYLRQARVLLKEAEKDVASDEAVTAVWIAAQRATRKLTVAARSWIWEISLHTHSLREGPLGTTWRLGCCVVLKEGAGKDAETTDLTSHHGHAKQRLCCSKPDRNEKRF